MSPSCQDPAHKQSPDKFLVESTKSYGDERKEESIRTRLIREGFREQAELRAEPLRRSEMALGCLWPCEKQQFLSSQAGLCDAKAVGASVNHSGVTDHTCWLLLAQLQVAPRAWPWEAVLLPASFFLCLRPEGGLGRYLPRGWQNHRSKWNLETFKSSGSEVGLGRIHLILLDKENHLSEVKVKRGTCSLLSLGAPQRIYQKAWIQKGGENWANNVFPKITRSGGSLVRVWGWVEDRESWIQVRHLAKTPRRTWHLK